MDLDGIHEALAAQIAAYINGTGLDPDEVKWNVASFPWSAMPAPCVEVWPGSPDYVAYFGTFGPNGHGDVSLDVRVYIDGANAETVFKRVTTVLSVGTGESESVVDAIMSDRTLGGEVSDVRVLSASWQPNDGGLSGVVRIPVEIVVKKSGAKV